MERVSIHNVGLRHEDVEPPQFLHEILAGKDTQIVSVVCILDGAQAAALAAHKFGATAVLTGEVLRYRERSGEALGTSRPASVGFELKLYAAPGGERLWTALFQETQQTITENVLRARRYPGRGTRWLTAAELARWGAQSAVDSLLAAR